jgi:hypothetical protein
MGRGRSKAKQEKSARELKYRNQVTDLNKLTKDLQSDLTKETEIDRAWAEHLQKDQ